MTGRERLEKHESRVYVPENYYLSRHYTYRIILGIIPITVSVSG